MCPWWAGWDKWTCVVSSWFSESPFVLLCVRGYRTRRPGFVNRFLPLFLYYFLFLRICRFRDYGDANLILQVPSLVRAQTTRIGTCLSKKSHLGLFNRRRGVIWVFHDVDPGKQQARTATSLRLTVTQVQQTGILCLVWQRATSS